MTLREQALPRHKAADDIGGFIRKMFDMTRHRNGRAEPRASSFFWLLSEVVAAQAFMIKDIGVKSVRPLLKLTRFGKKYFGPVGVARLRQMLPHVA